VEITQTIIKYPKMAKSINIGKRFYTQNVYWSKNIKCLTIDKNAHLAK